MFKTVETPIISSLLLYHLAYSQNAGVIIILVSFFLGSDEEQIIQHLERLKQMDEGAIVTVLLAEKELQMIYIATSTMQEYGRRLACTVSVILLWLKFLHKTC